jgi:ribosomal protein S6
MAVLDRQLRLADDVLRHKIVRLPEAAISGNKRKVSLEDIDTSPDRGERRSRDKDSR